MSGELWDADDVEEMVDAYERDLEVLRQDCSELLGRFQALHAIAQDPTISHHQLGKALREPGILGPA